MLPTLADECLALLHEQGAVAAGICGTEPLRETKVTIEDRLGRGLSGGMAFTYRNPARSCDPRSALPSARCAIVAAMPYPSARSARPADPVAEVARYAAQDTYARLRGSLGTVADHLKAAGWRGVVVADDNALVDRAIARRAGLGWYGKNTNLLVPGVGSWVVLGTVLTDAELARPAPPDAEEGCGSCRRCLDHCPTGALVAPGELDASRCLSWVLQLEGDFPRDLRVALGHRIYGCDDCQEVCPPNRLAPDVDADTAGPGPWLGLEWLLETSDEELLTRLGAWYIPRRDVRYVRRNALVVLGNDVAMEPDLRRALLRRFLLHDDRMLVAHAAWAARRHRLTDLLGQADVAGRDGVRDEMSQPVPDPLALDMRWRP